MFSGGPQALRQVLRDRDPVLLARLPKGPTGNPIRRPAASRTPPPQGNPAAAHSRPPQPAPRSPPPKGLDAPITKPFTRLDTGTWLHGRPEPDVYRLLIDAYRMRMADDHTFSGAPAPDTIDQAAGFARFLATVEQGFRPLLPEWWDDDRKTACLAFGRDGTDGWSSLSRAVTKADVTEHYGDARFAMQLRMFVEPVYGSGPGGCDGTEMRKGMAAMEVGGMFGGMDMSEVTSFNIDGTTGGVSHMVP
ncbi:hypothetical protein CONLIGDRAFT_626357 [Coniochaeta ligniaria NRRL 30616]|uniref:Uncharacterized protein n=1 Tax=Coniochaeta ligniaria NRRL 30616 TaxID=1408157 RepID=A0A1J7JWA5_9PEZI|nr:hypothetical protein CONLIGDRAFT_626357 [Coniochaeta ligniaria NRRL 30616]